MEKRYKDIQSPPGIQIPEKIPVFPLPNVILFPGIDLPLYIFEPRYRLMLKDCLAGQKFMAISLFREGWKDKDEPIPSHDIMGAGYVRAIFENPDGTSHILLKGVGRVEIVRYLQMEPYRIAKVREIPEQIQNAASLSKMSARLKKLVMQKLRLTSENPQEVLKFPKEFRNPVTLTYLAAFLSDAKPELKQDLLETADCRCRMKHLIEMFEEEIHPPASQN